MKIALAQINPIVGDLEYNFKLIVENVKKARAEKVDLLVLPELAILGYPPKDLLLKPNFLIRQDYYLKELAVYTDDDFGILVGAATANPSFGKKLFNSLILLYKGEHVAVGSKTLLPNYDVFDETRYFEPSPATTVVDFKGVKLGLSICEDIWIEAYPSMYTRDPIADMVLAGVDLIINSAASPFVYDKPKRRENLLSNAARKYKKPIIYVNQVGANDQLIFDGSSLSLDTNGEVIDRLKAFEQDFKVIDTASLIIRAKNDCELHSTKLKPSIDEENNQDLSSVRKAITLGIRDFVKKCGFEKAILGVSGGIDSALVAALAVDALGAENVYVVSMPSQFTSQQSIDDAIKLAKNLGLLKDADDAHKTKLANGDHFEIVSIEAMHEMVQKLMPQVKDHSADENIQARLRAVLLMAFSNTLNAILLNTGNKSETAVGYSTIYGDSCGGLAVISDVLKTTVYRMANEINKDKEVIPQSIIDRAPSAELRPDQHDQESLPPYDVLDKIILLYVQEMKSAQEIIDTGFDEALVFKILNMIDRAEHKRQQGPPGLKVAGKAFGLGRRMPIAHRFKDAV